MSATKILWGQIIVVFLIVLFTIWAATQTYADFDVQVCAVLGRAELKAKDHQRATEHVVALLLRGCGLGA